MTWTLLGIFDLVGTIAFAISGAFTAVHKGMDIFGVNVLAVTTACGGGLLRDLIVGKIPPKMFLDPFYVGVAVIVANIVFVLLYLHRRMPPRIAPAYEHLFFWFDTVGLAAFTVDGVMIGADAGYAENIFLLSFLGFMTGVGGGALRDIMSGRTPDIFTKHVYALASILGGVSMNMIYQVSGSWKIAMPGAFLIIIILRYLAARFRWNLPKVS